MTKIWKVQPDASSAHPFLAEAGAMIAEGDTVAFPTETVYGLGADAGNTKAVEAIFTAKGRPSDNPLIVHIAHIGQLNGLVEEINPISRRLMDAFWPGPLTLVLPVRSGAVSPRVTAGLTTVAVRMPDHPIALSLIRAAGCPVAAPSANRSGRPSPTVAAHVYGDLDGRIGGIVDGGATGVGLESTVVVVEAREGSIRVLRPGGVTVADLRRAVPGAEIVVETTAEEAEAPRSPGMKYAHYAPQGRLTIVHGDKERAVSWARDSLAEAKRTGERTGVMTVAEHTGLYEADLVIGCGSAGDMNAVAQQLYAALRRFDEAGITYILAEGYESSEGIGLAVMNRLNKAAGHRVVRV
ncbi:threonylcarbamoyl-AMP synthase [Paenibacillus mesophilus]|uniref:L-threonylcarbamoyladenylate synthase n=1 Tax=Paenibacillus mesophilus TaxID=2582849 RepID=UPI00110E13AD|nr:L-threonylcarbamoyladenylate synthase [Paenibacillus mesophilus]TMV47115.1 threonylcarbamoyl-AMP synthase [Paenibacillus mesophilus]